MRLEFNAAVVRREYFKIRNLLNKNNKTKNEVSELVFELRELGKEYFIIIKSSRANHGLRLATFDRVEWKIFENNNYANFYKYMFKRIRSIDSFDNKLIGEELAVWLTRLWVL